MCLRTPHHATPHTCVYCLCNIGAAPKEQHFPPLSATHIPPSLHIDLGFAVLSSCHGCVLVPMQPHFAFTPLQREREREGGRGRDTFCGPCLAGEGGGVELFSWVVLLTGRASGVSRAADRKGCAVLSRGEEGEHACMCTLRTLRTYLHDCVFCPVCEFLVDRSSVPTAHMDVMPAYRPTHTSLPHCIACVHRQVFRRPPIG